MRGWLALLILLLAAPLATSPASTALKLCNRTSYVLYGAVSAVTSPGSVTQGWTRIIPGDCATAIAAPLTAQSYMVYARSSLAHAGQQKAWGGDFPVCVKDSDFRTAEKVTQPYCTGADMFALNFAALDTAGKRDWTMNFDEEAQYSLADAQLVGAKRLLKDNGFDPGPLTPKPDRLTAKALAGARAKFGLDKTDNAQLFAALENAARKTGAPAGYTVCNDTKDGLLVATGAMENGKPVSRGWWTLGGGACARTITSQLSQDAVWLFAQKQKGGAVAVSGPQKFCLANGAFEIAGVACAPVMQAGFVRTDTHGLAGYVAHIGPSGLGTPVLRQQEISK